MQREYALKILNFRGKNHLKIQKKIFQKVFAKSSNLFFYEFSKYLCILL